LGIGDWAQSPIPNPQSPIPNPQSPLYFKSKKIIKIYYCFYNYHEKYTKLFIFDLISKKKMAEVEFNFDGKKEIVQCEENEMMKNICQNFIKKIDENQKSIYFSYNGIAGNSFNENLTFDQMINSEDKKRNRMSILVSKNEIEEEEVKDIIKSKDIICPKCGESIKIDIKDYKITLFECKNKHKIDNILLDEFENTQNIDNKKIICQICNNIDKSISYNKIFYRCCNCEKNICPLCKSIHDNTHKIIDYDDKLYICNKHYKNYNSYCKECKLNLCIECAGEHKSHEKIYFGDIIVNKDELIKKNNNLRNNIDSFIHEIEIIINILKEVINKMNKYYKIIEDLINNFNIKNRNYEILYNLNKIKENNIEKELENIINSDIGSKINSIFNIYKNMNFNEINIIYKVNEDDNEVKLFSSGFVERNKNKCKIIYEGKEEELKEKMEIYTSWFSTKIKKLEIKLKGILSINNMSGIFSGCSSLLSLPDISNWNTSNITDMSNMFYGCSSLSSLPDISKWNTSNVTNMSFMFCRCSSLSSLPDISKWNTKNITDMSNMFCNCSSLLSLPDISKWNTSNIINMSYMFSKCSLLSSLPNISNWNTSNITDISGMFLECSSLLCLPDISNWNISNIINMSDMFEGCNKSLKIFSKFK